MIFASVALQLSTLLLTLGLHELSENGSTNILLLPAESDVWKVVRVTSQKWANIWRILSDWSGWQHRFLELCSCSLSVLINVRLIFKIFFILRANWVGPQVFEVFGRGRVSLQSLFVFNALNTESTHWCARFRWRIVIIFGLKAAVVAYCGFLGLELHEDNDHGQLHEKAHVCSNDPRNHGLTVCLFGLCWIWIVVIQDLECDEVIKDDNWNAVDKEEQSLRAQFMVVDLSWHARAL